MTDHIAIMQARPLPEDATPPEWIHLIPEGTVTTRDGRGPYRSSAEVVAAASLQAGDRLPIDQDHATDLAAPNGHPAPAVGWIVALEARADGLWGRVEWNKSGRALLSDRAYRGISPVFLHDAAGAVVRVLRASLTNRPNLRGLTALNQEISMSLIKIAAALGLAETADEAAVLAAAEKAVKLAKEAEAVVVTHAKLAKALKLADGAAGDVVLAAVETLADPARSVPAEQVVALQGELKRLVDDRAREKATAAVDQAIAEGRVGIRPLRDHYIARHMADPAAVDKELAAMPAVQPGAMPAPSAHARPAAKVAKDAPVAEITRVALQYQQEQEKAGMPVSWAEAVTAVTGA